MDGRIIAADRERGFADWGTTVVLREVVQTFDPERGTVEESATDREISAIIANGELKGVAGAAGHPTRTERSFLVRSEEIGPGGRSRLLRIVCAEGEFRVDTMEAWPAGGLLMLRCIAV